LDGRNFTVNAGETAFVNSEMIHGATPTDGCVYECIVFNPEFLKSQNGACNRFLDDLLSQRILLPELFFDEELSSITERIFRAMDEQRDGYIFKVIGLTNLLLATALEKKLYSVNTGNATERDVQKILKLKRVLKFIRDNFDKEITLDDMAREADLSTKYFCSFFKATTGTTPVRYLMTYRVERAARKLGDSDDSVTKIAFDCGFNDLSYFIKTFKEIKGVSPSKYRKK
jgi:AraC-like DNA-binding protein